MFQASSQQSAYFAFLRNPHAGSLVLEACAGAGKSTTLIQGLDFMSGNVFIGAFNKSAAADLQAKARRVDEPKPMHERNATRSGVRIGTMHSAGFGTWRRVCEPSLKVEPNKTAGIFETLLQDYSPEDQARLSPLMPFVCKTVSIGKQLLCGPKWKVDNTAMWFKTIEHFGLDSDLFEGVDMNEAIEIVQRVFRIGADSCRDMVDYDDMIWAPIAYNCRFYQNDWVLIDEAQDTNPARRELARRLLKPSGRLIAVGDSRQAIYGFTGADADSLDLIQREFKTSRLPLSVSYRCPHDVVKYAHNFVSPTHIEAHEDALSGIVRTVEAKKGDDGRALPWHATEPLSETDAILCRFNAPLITTAFKLIRAGVACRVEGRDIGRGLIDLARRWKVRSLDKLEERLDTWLEREIRKAEKKKSEVAKASAQDRRDTLQVFIDRCRAKGNNTLYCLVAEINALFADDVKDCLTLASGHKSKGREWKRVYWLRHKELDYPGMQEWQKNQELNLSYVIATRAMHELALIPIDIQ